jgi:hypothetical protein
MILIANLIRLQKINKQRREESDKIRDSNWQSAIPLFDIHPTNRLTTSVWANCKLDLNINLTKVNKRAQLAKMLNSISKCELLFEKGILSLDTAGNYKATFADLPETIKKSSMFSDKYEYQPVRNKDKDPDSTSELEKASESDERLILKLNALTSVINTVNLLKSSATNISNISTTYFTQGQIDLVNEYANKL